MVTIRDETLEAGFLPKGAELKSLKTREGDIEFVWQADPAFWGKSSPLLFPIIGSLKDGFFLHEGKEYRLPRHGFARDREFTQVSADERSVRFVLESDEETRKVYPFDWTLSVEYALYRNILATTYTVTNKGPSDMPFSIGAHPAFKLPLFPDQAYDTAWLEFERPERLVRGFLDADGLLTKEKLELPTEGKCLPLRKELFDRDALIFESLSSRRVTLRNQDCPWSLSMEFPGFSWFGLWAATGADFICLEPWKGVADRADRENSDIFGKPGIMVLKPGAESKSSWAVSVTKN